MPFPGIIQFGRIELALGVSYILDIGLGNT